MLRHELRRCVARVALLHRWLQLRAGECVCAVAREAASGATAGATMARLLLLMAALACFEINEALLLRGS